MHKRLFSYLGVVAILVGVFGCSKAVETDVKTTLRVDIGNEISTIDPARTEVAPDFRVVNDLFAGLLDFDQSNRPIPGMATNWDVSLDGKTYTFHLRPGLKFSDGTPITAQDFVYSWQRLVDPKTAAAYGFLLEDVVNANAIMQGKLPATSLGVNAPNDLTVMVTLVHPLNQFLTYLTAPAVDVVPQKVIEKYGQEWTNPEHIVTSGAYVLQDHVMNGYILAHKNPYFYAANNVAIQNVKYLPLTDTNVSLDTYRSGALDTTWQNVPIDKFAQIKTEFGTQLHVVPWEKTIFFNFNLRLPKYANNKDLRQALVMALDRNVLTGTVLKSGQKPLYSIVTPSIENGKYADTAYPWASLSEGRLVQMAQTLYKKAGYSDANPLEVTLKYRNNDLDKKTALAMAAMWQSTLGVKVKLENQEYKALLQALHKGDFDIAEGNWGADYNSVTTYTPLYKCNNGNNHSFYCNSDYDKLLATAETLVNPTAQMSVYKAAIKLANDDYPTIPVYEPTHQRLVNPRVQGYAIESNYLDNVQSKWFHLN